MCTQHVLYIISLCLIAFQAAESKQCPSFHNAKKAGTPKHTKLNQSLADGLGVTKVGSIAFDIARDHAVSCVVKEDWIALAILRLVEIEKCVVEGAGAVGLAACLAGKLKDFKQKK